MFVGSLVWERFALGFFRVGGVFRRVCGGLFFVAFRGLFVGVFVGFYDEFYLVFRFVRRWFFV